MSLQKAYLNNVKSSKRITGSSMGLPPIERDPTIMQLEKDLFSKIREINPPETVKVSKDVAPLSVEDAIKELIQTHKNSKK